jgi:hypothetical protein
MSPTPVTADTIRRLIAKIESLPVDNAPPAPSTTETEAEPETTAADEKADE